MFDLVISSDSSTFNVLVKEYGLKVGKVLDKLCKDNSHGITYRDILDYSNCNIDPNFGSQVRDICLKVLVRELSISELEAYRILRQIRSYS